MAKVLILEDTIDVVATLKGMLEDEGHVAETEMNPTQVMEKIRRFDPDLVTLDISFSQEGDETGITLLEQIRTEYPKSRLPILVISGTANADKLTRMMDWDINGFLGKPVKHDELKLKISDALEIQTNGYAAAGSWEARMVGESPAILELIPEIGKAAKAESDLLVTGESGAGKEQVVQKYRELSPRRHKPFVVIDCTNIPQNTFEAEIFGHEKGAFTGANERKRGKIEAAEGGIVFFDEIGDLPLKQQAKLLRLLQEKIFTRMQSNDPVKLNAVVIAATNKNLHDMMEKETLRKDIYYRLQHMKIEMPPLRDHLEDIPALVEHFIQKANGKFRKTIVGADPEVILRFQNMRWDGNVRQLELCLEYGVVKCEGQRLKWRDLESYFKDEIGRAETENPSEIDFNLKYAAFNRSLEEETRAKQRRYYLHCLERNHFNIRQTALDLEMERTYLTTIMKRLKIQKPAKN